MNNNYSNKHLTYEERLIIEEGITKRLRKFEIANLINKGQSIYHILTNHPELNICV